LIEYPILYCSDYASCFPKSERVAKVRYLELPNALKEGAGAVALRDKEEKGDKEEAALFLSFNSFFLLAA
jgi:hypothetical protein